MIEIQTVKDIAWSFTIILLLIIFSLWYNYRRRLFTTFKELEIPGPEPNLLFGNYLELARKNPLKCHKEWIEKYGKIFGYYFGTHPTLVVADIELVKQILIKDFHKFPNRPLPLGSNPKSNESEGGCQSKLSNLRGKKWKETRNIITPSFTANKMKLMIPMMSSAVDSLMDILDKVAETNQSFDIYKLYQGLTMDVIGRTAFGIETDVQKNSDNIILKASKALFSSNFNNIILALYACFPELGSFWRQLNKYSLYFKNERRNPLADVIQHTTNILRNRRSNIMNSRQDLLQFMIDAKIKESDLNKITNDELTAGNKTIDDINNKEEDYTDSEKQFRQMTDHQIVENSVLFFLAGYETTSSALAFVTHLLTENPDIQEKIRKEIKSNMETKEALDYTSIQQMKYLEQVIMEAIRLYPPIYLHVNREASEDVQYGKYKITKGMTIQIPVYYLNHDPELWENPEVFIPERFAPENKSKINFLAFQSFGAGPRNCVGLRFALLEIKLALIRILQKYKLVSSKESKSGPLKFRISQATLAPSEGVNLKLLPLG